MVIYFNIYGRVTEAFLGTVKVECSNRETLPGKHAIKTACDILGADGAPGGIKAILSTEKQFNLYGLNR